MARPLMAVIATLLYVGCLHFAYQHDIAPLFYYLRYTYREPDQLAYPFAILLIAILALALPKRIKQPSHFMLWILFIIVIVPSIVISQISDVLTVARATELAVWVTISFLLVIVFGTRRVLRGTLPLVGLSAPAFWVLICLASGIVYVYILASVGLKFELPSLDDVYSVREDFAGVAATSGLLVYLVPLQANLLNPIMMIRGLYTKRWVWLIAGILGQVYVYSFTGFKTAILSPLAIILAYYLFRVRYRPGGATILAGGAGIIGIVLAIDGLTSSNDVTSLIVRRFLVTPGLLTAGYVDVFYDLEKARLAHSIFKSFFSYPYLQEPPLLVGSAFFHHPGTNANASFLADGFANFGYGGMVAECLVLVLVLWAIDDAARSIPVGISSLVFLMPTLALAESGVLTSIWTHGLLAGIVICLFMPRTGWAKKRNADDAPRTRAPTGDPDRTRSFAALPPGAGAGPLAPGGR